LFYRQSYFYCCCVTKAFFSSILISPEDLLLLQFFTKNTELLTCVRFSGALNGRVIDFKLECAKNDEIYIF